jgi:hypothetical protein
MSNQDGVGDLKDRMTPPGGAMSRRAFVGLTAAGLAGWAVPRSADGSNGYAPEADQVAVTSDIRTNIDEALKIPRTATSMPGKYPGLVVKVQTGKTASGGAIDARLAKSALDQGLMKLTGKNTARDAWMEFVSPSDQVGIKVNPIPRLPTSFELTRAVIDGLLEAGIPREQIAVWDRRLFQLHEAGFTAERFPGIELLGTEVVGPNGKYTDEKGDLWSLKNIDRESLSYYADIEGVHSPDGLPFMVNGGKHSYFSKLVTRRFTKIINLPVLKSVRPVGISFCLKNLAYGALSNTSRLHQVGVNAIPEACAFPCLRDKTVLHIGDALRASYYGGVGAPPRYTWDANLLFLGSDGVAVDLVAQEFLLAERVARGVQSGLDPADRLYLDIASKLGLGVSNRAKIDLREFTMT